MRKNSLLAAAFLTFLVCVAYFNSLGNGFVSDDEAILVDPAATSFSTILTRPHRFVQPLLNAVLFTFFGPNQTAFRITNILFHLATVLLIAYLIKSMTGKRSLGLMTASLFAVHPLLTESITWVSAGSSVRYTFFFLLSLSMYRLFRKSEGQKYYIYALLFYCLSIASSEKAVVLPFAYLLYDYCFHRKKFWWKASAGFFIISILFTMNTIPVVISFAQIQKNNSVTGLHNPLTQIPTAIGTYIMLFFWPDKLDFLHWEVLALEPSRLALHMIIFLVYSGCVIVSFIKKNYHLAFWLCFFFISLLLTLTPLKFASVVAERYVYPGTIGLTFAFSWIFSVLLKKFRFTPLFYSLFILIIIILIARTHIRNRDWFDDISMMRAQMRIDPHYGASFHDVSNMFARRKQHEKAIEVLLIAISDYPDAVKKETRSDIIYNDIGWYYYLLGQNDLAVEYFDKSLAVNPKGWLTEYNKGYVYYMQKKYDEAFVIFDDLYEKYPRNDFISANVGIAYFEQENSQRAKELFEYTLKLNPKNETALEGIAELNKK